MTSPNHQSRSNIKLLWAFVEICCRWYGRINDADTKRLLHNLPAAEADLEVLSMLDEVLHRVAHSPSVSVKYSIMLSNILVASRHVGLPVLSQYTTLNFITTDCYVSVVLGQSYKNTWWWLSDDKTIQLTGGASILLGLFRSIPDLIVTCNKKLTTLIECFHFKTSFLQTNAECR